MADIEDLVKVVASIQSTPTKVFVPDVGHRLLTKTPEGKLLDTGGRDFTSSFHPQKQEYHEDNQRKDVGELASNDAVNSIRTVNLGLLRTMNTLKSFQELKQVLLNDIDTDMDVIQNFESIEQYLQQIQEKYSTKKESLRNQFK